MKFLLADLKGTRGLVSKDTVAGGYGSRLLPFSRVTSVYAQIKQRFHSGFPSIQLGYVAAILAAEGHKVSFTDDATEPCDVAIILSSLVDHRRETAWADRVRATGARVGFVGLTASKLPHLFKDHADFVVNGEPESAARALAQGERLSGITYSEAVQDLDSLPFPRWDLLVKERGLLRRALGLSWNVGFPVMASRSCPEFCTYCPHRILTEHRERSVPNIIAELERLASTYHRPHIVFRDPLFTWRRDRLEQLCRAIVDRGIGIHFECETRLDCLDEPLLDLLKSAGLRLISFGVESLSEDTLRRVGRRPIPDTHQRAMMRAAADRKIETCGFYVFGFLEDTWDSISATINYAIAMGSNFAQFKMLTPYPGTPLYKRLAPLVYESDWEKFDGFTPTFNHPSLSAQELRFLLAAAYSRFYLRPSFLASYLRIQDGRLRMLAEHLDEAARRKHREAEATAISRVLEC